jgi:shikimate dehydrogenase
MNHTRRQFGLIGYPLQHSFSPGYFKEKFEREGINAVYAAYPLAEIQELNTLLGNGGLDGLNVTIPYKQSVLPCLNELDAAAKAIGAVNCIDLREGKRKGYNTDVIGFKESLMPLLQPQHTKALVLGTGGSSLAVRYVLTELGIIYQMVSRERREGIRSYEDITPDVLQAHTLIVNTTPLGMYPNTEACASLPYEYITSQHLLYDLVYNPTETLFLKKGKERDAITKNGLEMLHLQAEASWRIWNS